MKIVTFTITGKSPYSQSKLISTTKANDETARDHEARCWRERMHVDAKGNVYIPPMAIKNSLSEAAKFLSVGVPGKGKATYTKNIEAGVLCLTPIEIVGADGKPIKASTCPGEWFFVPSDGRRGGGKRVEKCFPIIAPGWRGQVQMEILDAMVTPEVLEMHLHHMGKLIGIGRFRPRNNGFYGRFDVSNIEWKDVDTKLKAAA